MKETTFMKKESAMLNKGMDQQAKKKKKVQHYEQKTMNTSTQVQSTK